MIVVFNRRLSCGPGRALLPAHLPVLVVLAGAQVDLGKLATHPLQIRRIRLLPLVNLVDLIFLGQVRHSVCSWRRELFRPLLDLCDKSEMLLLLVLRAKLDTFVL